MKRIERVYVDTSVFGGFFDDAVNTLNGYAPIAIHSPLEVVSDE